MIGRRNIEAGIYLVIDPSMEQSLLLKKIELVLKEKIVALQIWDNFYEGQDIEDLINKICAIAQPKAVPVLINNKWKFLKTTLLDGVHFDETPLNIDEIRSQIDRPFLQGITCTNDLALVQWASEKQLNYISFCSIFPSTTSNSCELVNFETIKEARKISSMPIFLAGGIKPENINKLETLDYTGIAVVSGIMSSEKPEEAIKKYNEKLTIHLK